MVDAARAYTNRELADLEKKLERVYARALNEVREKWDTFQTELVEREKPFTDAILSAERGGDPELIKRTRAAHKKFLGEVTAQNEKYHQLVTDISGYLSNIDQQAYAIANGYLPAIYAHNYNSLALPRGYVYNLVDSTTVKNLLYAKYDLLKGERWNRQRLNAEVLQGVLQGESIPKIADRLEPFVGGNRAAAVRAARTSVTCAENKGRLDSMIAAKEECGLVYKKQWVATHDSRVRKSHADLDGETVFLDEPFSNGLQYPADPDGKAAEVYNCRCTMNRLPWGTINKDGKYKAWHNG